VFTLFGLEFFLIGATCVRHRPPGEYAGPHLRAGCGSGPRYLVQAVLEKKE